jgi:hypothetical protein
LTYTISFESFNLPVNEGNITRNTNGIRTNSLNEIRVLVYPRNYDGGDYGYYNDWVYNRITAFPPLNQEIKEQIDAIIPDQANASEKSRIIFDWVKEEISYIDIEGGINSFIPRDANVICQRQKGDCKDMSNLLYQSLNYVGVDAYLAVSATISHRFDFDFPSFASGNHMICVVKIEGQIICLDATEDLCKFPKPSRQIQGRSIFIHNAVSGELYRVPIIDASVNKAYVQFNIIIENKQLNGDYSIVMHEMSSYIFKELYHDYSEIDYESYVKNWFDINAEKTKALTIETYENDSLISVTGAVSFSNSIVNSIGNKTYISLKFIPFPHDYSSKIDTNERLLTFYASEVKFEGNVHFDKEIKLQEKEVFDFDEDGFKYSFSVEQTDKKSISINYDYILNEVEITSKEKIKLYNRLNEEIIHSLNSRIILEN